MPTYLSPGVYVEEIASGSAPIVGVGTSTAGFIGKIDADTSLSTDLVNVLTTPVGSKTAPVSIADGKGGNQKNYSFSPQNYPVVTTKGTYGFFVNGKPVDLDETNPITNNNDSEKSVTVKFKEPIEADAKITGYYLVQSEPTIPQAKSNIAREGEIKLCTNFTEFKKFFGDFLPSSDATKGHNTLAHAVYGFFINGGTRCYIARITNKSTVSAILEDFEAIDEIAIVAAPGIIDKPTRSAIVTHCQNMGDRLAILDCDPNKNSSNVAGDKPDNSDYAAYYFPWIKVADPVGKITNPNAKGEDLFVSVPPSGHIAGVYARVDAQRGVHKAPANETILGALGLDYKISKNQQSGLNPQGINCIRELNGNIRVWGARTIGGDANGEFKYINVRRLFLSLKDAIDKGTQWTVFEPNDAELWAKIRRNVNAYLTNVWRSGALFGVTPQEAFFVKCDAENNPPEVRDLGQVVIEIGVAPVKPAEFVIFRISQWAGDS